MPMSRIRRRIAQRLVQAQRTAAMLSTFNEVDLREIMSLRARHKERFQEKHGVSLGLMSLWTGTKRKMERTEPMGVTSRSRMGPNCSSGRQAPEHHGNWPDLVLILLLNPGDVGAVDMAAGRLP